MSILIRGMDMPTDGSVFSLVIFSATGEVAKPNYDKTFRTIEGAKAVAVPPHGRLIDADAFAAKTIEIIERQGYDDFYAQSLSVGEILREVVVDLRGEGLNGFSNAPTIIEADMRGETDGT